MPESTSTTVMIHLLAQVQPKDLSHWETRARTIFEGWQNTSDVFPVRHFGYILLGVLLLLLGLWLRQWYKQRPPGPTPGRFFYRLCRRLELGWLDQLLLVRIARQQKLPSPLTLLMARNTFETHLARYCASLLPMRRPLAQARGQRMGERLFGTAAQAQKDACQALADAEFNLVDPDDLSAAQRSSQAVAGATSADSSQAHTSHTLA